MPRFMAIILGDAAAEEADTDSPEVWQAIMDDYNEFGANAGAAGVIGGGRPSSRQHRGRHQGERQGRHASPAPRSPSPRPRRSSAASTCSMPTTWTRRSTGPAQIPGAWHGPGRGPAVHRLQHLGLTRGRGRGRVPGRGARALATLTRVLGDLDRAEDAVQDAFVVALEQWPRTGIPDKPGAWITTIARHKAIDRLRRDAKRTDKQSTAHRGLAALDGWDDPDPQVVRDDLLRLVFTCCHPVLPIEGRVALALRTLCGLSTAEVARLFLVPEATMAQRLVRAKRRLADTPVPRSRCRPPHELPDRLPAVLATVHLLFTEGHNATSGRRARARVLCDEAARLAALLVDLMPDEPEVLGLHALHRAHRRPPSDPDQRRRATSCRSPTRTASSGGRARHRRRGWRRSRRPCASAPPGEYQLEAAIAACHASAPTYATPTGRRSRPVRPPREPRSRPGRATRSRCRRRRGVGPRGRLDVLDGVVGLDDFPLRWSVDASCAVDADSRPPRRPPLAALACRPTTPSAASSRRASPRSAPKRCSTELMARIGHQ